MKKYRAEFSRWVHMDSRAEEFKQHRLATWQTVSKMLSRRRIDKISRSDVKKVVVGFHSMRAVDIAPARFLRPANNELQAIRQAWKRVLYPDPVPLESAMRQCKDSLYGFGKSSIQELLGTIRGHTRSEMLIRTRASAFSATKWRHIKTRQSQFNWTRT